jgi:hypothetical protein
VDDAHQVKHSVAHLHLHQGAQAWFGAMVTTENQMRSLSTEDRKKVNQAANRGRAVDEPGLADAAIYCAKRLALIRFAYGVFLAGIWVLFFAINDKSVRWLFLVLGALAFITFTVWAARLAWSLRQNRALMARTL